MCHPYVNWFHILVVGPFLLWAGLNDHPQAVVGLAALMMFAQGFILLKRNGFSLEATIATLAPPKRNKIQCATCH